jgi:hypothetical protein
MVCKKPGDFEVYEGEIFLLYCEEIVGVDVE